jgi:carbamoylphosphate synthase large subunit
VSDAGALTMLCMASFEKGFDFMRECKAQGARVLLLTVDHLHDRPWPRECLDQIYMIPTFDDRPNLLKKVGEICWHEQIDRIVPLDDYDVEVAAAVREHMRCPGMGDTTARFFRDKLAMRVQARDEGVLIPECCPVLNANQIHEFTQRVPPPWVVKPRSEAAAVGIKKVANAEQLWQVLDGLAERRNMFLIEKYVVGRVCHVDSIVYDSEVVFAEPSRYGTPPLDVAHGGGVFTSATVNRQSPEAQALLKTNKQVLKALHYVRGVSHSEYIEGADGKVYFLETSARVAGANLPVMVEAATGVNLWREWAKVELAGGKSEYKLPPVRQDYAGIILSLAKQEKPDTSAYNDAEVVWRLDMKHHAGLVMRASSPGRIDELLDQYQRRYMTDFFASQPPLDKPLT